MAAEAPKVASAVRRVSSIDFVMVNSVPTKCADIAAPVASETQHLVSNVAKYGRIAVEMPKFVLRAVVAVARHLVWHYATDVARHLVWHYATDSLAQHWSKKLSTGEAHLSSAGTKKTAIRAIFDASIVCRQPVWPLHELG